MKVNIDIQLQDNYVLAKYRGPDSPEISRAIIQQLVDACDEHQCFRIMVLAYLENSLSIIDNYDLATMFREVGFSSKHRLAWVDLNPDTHESTRFAETVLFNRAIQARLFYDEEDARQWLLPNMPDVT